MCWACWRLPATGELSCTRLAVMAQDYCAQSDLRESGSSKCHNCVGTTLSGSVGCASSSAGS
jgi:hypothetical protein